MLDVKVTRCFSQMKIILSFLLLIIFLGSNKLYAQIFTGLLDEKIVSPELMLISDIDDTIKISHVLSNDKFVNFLDFTTPFRGMSPLYTLLKNQYKDKIKIVYLSNAPKSILGFDSVGKSHVRFLKYNQFPEGELILRESLFDQNHKINRIRELIDSYHPKKVIFIGDNGERDAEIYYQAVNEFKGSEIQFFTYIHQLYSKRSAKEVGKPLQAKQVGFVTSVELSYDLFKNSILNVEGYSWMTQKVMPLIVTEQEPLIETMIPLSFPDFKDCSDFEMKVFPPELMPLEQKIKIECF